MACTASTSTTEESRFGVCAKLVEKCETVRDVAQCKDYCEEDGLRACVAVPTGAVRDFKRDATIVAGSAVAAGIGMALLALGTYPRKPLPHPEFSEALSELIQHATAIRAAEAAARDEALRREQDTATAFDNNGDDNDGNNNSDDGGDNNDGGNEDDGGADAAMVELYRRIRHLPQAAQARELGFHNEPTVETSRRWRTQPGSGGDWKTNPGWETSTAKTTITFIGEEFPDLGG